ncbi:nitric oxide synthase-interacting protein homolog [Portunus trituberculatus]|uniref:nitric oxide synthase-interacting protein homolog n=1 Tax=Portunus trituberculatus TaxID=210409 RepID=UPI001E1CDC2B|nr:nitric oxide synthase-interacting protein homolog [Portunus trituberculatus]XP_045135031.1 nitric oxide synthase-interacting protein homolog [Portunus trituberculatus]XP_045135039.1 nitric oxide synthase-interacting protein homolog [Portunus trituberculatus]
MTRHSKNCTASSVYSYHEKRKDAKVSGYGTLQLRYGKDGVKDFDCCSLSLHPCRNPVITPEGHLFDKEAILEYIISKKNEISRKMKEYDRQCKKEQTELAELSEAENRSRVEKFLQTEMAVSSASQAAQGKGTSTTTTTTSTATQKAGTSGSAPPAGSSVSNMVAGREKKLPSFWIPSLTPGNKEAKIAKPDKTIMCPISGKPLKAKDLITVKFTLALDGDKGRGGAGPSLEGAKERYKCPVTGDVLRNNVACVVLRPTGDVVTQRCVETIIRKDMKHPLTGQTLTEKDIITLQRGGTGFATANQHLASEKARPVLQA